MEPQIFRGLRLCLNFFKGGTASQIGYVAESKLRFSQNECTKKIHHVKSLKWRVKEFYIENNLGPNGACSISFIVN